MERSKILVVDDEKLVRRMIARVLESEGMSIVEASNGLDAVQMAKAQPFDLIILDIIMEGIDGFQVIHQLRSEGMLTPVFILSGRQADNDKVFACGGLRLLYTGGPVTAPCFRDAAKTSRFWRRQQNRVIRAFCEKSAKTARKFSDSAN